MKLLTFPVNHTLTTFLHILLLRLLRFHDNRQEPTNRTDYIFKSNKLHYVCKLSLLRVPIKENGHFYRLSREQIFIVMN